MGVKIRKVIEGVDFITVFVGRSKRLICGTSVESME